MRKEVIRFSNEQLKALVNDLNKAILDKDASATTVAQTAVNEELAKHNKALKEARYDFIASLEEPMFEFLKCGMIPRTKLKNTSKKDELAQYVLDDGYAKADLFEFVDHVGDKSKVCSDYDKAITRLWYNFNIFMINEGELSDKCKEQSCIIPWNMQDVTLGLKEQPTKFSKTNLAKQLDYVVNEVLLPEHANHIKATNIDVNHICTLAYGGGSKLATVKRPKIDGMFATALLSACYKLTNNLKYELVDRQIYIVSEDNSPCK